MVSTLLRRLARKFSRRGGLPRPIRPTCELLEDRLAPAVRTWDGATVLAGRPLPTANADWSNPQNWVGDVAPAVGDDLVFPAGALRRAGQNNNFAAGTAFNSIRFEGDGYGVTGSAVNLGAGGLTATNVAGINTLGVGLTLDATRTISVAGGSLVLNGVLGGAGGLTKTGAGVLELGGAAGNTAAGAFSVQAGTLRLNKTAGIDAVAGPLTVGQSAAADPAAAVVLLKANQVKNGIAVTVNPRGTLDLGGVNDSFGALNIVGGLVKTGVGVLTLGGNVTATSALGSPARIEGNLARGTVGVRVFTVEDGPSATDLLVSAAFSGASDVSKEGAGRMELTGANSGLTGEINVNAGVLRASNGLALGPDSVGGRVDVAAGAVLEVSGAGAIPKDVTLAGSGIGGGGALVFVGGAGQISGDVTLLSDATIRTDSVGILSGNLGGSAALTKTGTSALRLQGANAGFTGAIAVAQGTLGIMNSQALGSTAAGTSVSAGATLDASFSGESAEPLTLAGTGVGAGVGALTGDASLTGPITLAADTTVGSFVQPQGTGDDGFVGTLNLGGAIGGAFDLTVGQGFVAFSGAAPNTYGDTAVTGGAQLQLNKSPGVNAIPGGTLTVNGGTVTASTDNQIADAATVSVSNGRVKFDAAEAVGALTLSDSLVDGTGTLTLNGDVTVNGGNLGSSLQTNTSLGAATPTFTVNAGGGLTVGFTNTLSGGAGVGLTKAGSGPLFLSAAATYGGATTVNAGTLVVDRPLASAVVVNGGELIASGPLGAVNASGGAIDPGTSTDGVFGPSLGVLEVGGALALGAASTLHVDLGGTSPGANQDQVRLTGAGTVNLGGAKLEVAFKPGFQSAVGNRYTILQNDTATPTVGQLRNTAGAAIANAGEVLIDNKRFLLTYNDGDGNDVVLTHVNTATALGNRAITSPVAQGGVARLTGTIEEPDAGDSFFLNVNWGDGTAAETFAFAPDAPRDVALTHAYNAAPGAYTVQLNWFDDQNQGNSATLSVTVLAPPTTTPPTPTPAATPTAAPITAALVTQKVGAGRKLFLKVFGADGRLKGQVVSPFQKPSFQAIAATAVDTNGDGVADAVRLVGRKGKKVVQHIVSV